MRRADAARRAEAVRDARAATEAADRLHDLVHSKLTLRFLADEFGIHAKIIRAKARSLAYRLHDPRLAGEYGAWRGWTDSWRKIAAQRFPLCPALPALPELPGAASFAGMMDYSAGMMDLADYCEGAARALMTKARRR